ncbi:MAG: hypothetical protein CM15mP120_00370 [Pseudomonadota bacterium]|nr:MAG: hypothetical protein CM15mP120_00370 [Pseudomonadota bacterium]
MVFIADGSKRLKPWPTFPLDRDRVEVGDFIAGEGMPVLWPKPVNPPAVPKQQGVLGLGFSLGCSNRGDLRCRLTAACMLAGVILGDLLGQLIGVKANVGGVGIAMLLLIWAVNVSGFKKLLEPPTAAGINFWSAMYIPIVIAMAAKQNVVAAVSSGWLAIVLRGPPSSALP